jgi:hypothetical protein
VAHPKPSLKEIVSLLWSNKIHPSHQLYLGYRTRLHQNSLRHEKGYSLATKEFL